MLNLAYLQKLLIIAIALSTITCAFIQKTKKHLPKSKYITIYSFFINMIIGILFCMTFTEINFPTSLWVGLFSFLGADSIYKTLEGKMAPHSEIVTKKVITIPAENLINKEDS